MRVDPTDAAAAERRLVMPEPLASRAMEARESAPQGAARGAAALERLAAILRGLPSVLVAYSGGVDSAVVLAVATRELGDRAFGVIGHSPSLAASELVAALDGARAMGARVETLATEELSRDGYRRNGADRCFHCKDTLYEALRARASACGAVIVDGTHVDDLGDHRPGRQAAGNHGVRSPLVEAQCGKADVRAMAETLALPMWNKPAMACLASRITQGVEVTAERLLQVEKAEAFLHERGLTRCRVRSQGDTARIEVFPEDMPLLVTGGLREELLALMRDVGFHVVTLDLAGLRESLRA